MVLMSVMIVYYIPDQLCLYIYKEWSLGLISYHYWLLYIVTVLSYQYCCSSDTDSENLCEMRADELSTEQPLSHDRTDESLSLQENSQSQLQPTEENSASSCKGAFAGTILSNYESVYI